MSKEKRKRTRNTTRDQYLLYLDYMENDYSFRSNTLNPTLGDNYLNNKWEELSAKLNSIGDGPNLDVGEWKKRFAEWKYSTRSKYRKLSEEHKKTGGGPAPDIKLSDIEERGLAVWGRAAIKGALQVTGYEGICLDAASNETEIIFDGHISCVNEDANQQISDIRVDDVLLPQISTSTTIDPTENEPTKILKRNKNIKNKSLCEMAEKLIDDTNMISKTNAILHETLQSFTTSYKCQREQEIKLKKEYYAEKIQLEKDKLKFKIAKYKYENKDFIFE